jgi:surface protein
MNKKKIFAIVLMSTAILGSLSLNNSDVVFASDTKAVSQQFKADNQLKDWKIDYKNNIATIIDYVGVAKDVVIPTVQDLKTWDSSTYAGLKEVHITKRGMRAAAKVADAKQGTLTISSNGEKVIADGEDWSFTFGSLQAGRFENKITAMNLNNLDVSNIKDMHNMFHDSYDLQKLAIDDWNVSNVTNMARLFNACHSLQTLDLNNWNVSNVADMHSLFTGCKNLQTINIKNWNVGNVKNMSFMFSGCTQLQNITINNWDVHNVKDMTAMFEECKNLQTLDLNNWMVFNVKDMTAMFSGCTQLQNITINNWHVDNVKNMNSMFYNCKSLQTLNLSEWNVRNVENVSYMFGGEDKLQTLDLSWWHLNDKVKKNRMFFNNGWGTSGITIYTNDPLIRKYDFEFDHRKNVQIIEVEDHAEEHAIDILNKNDWCSQLYTNAQGILTTYGGNCDKMFSALTLQKVDGKKIDLNPDCSSLPEEPLKAGDQLIFVPKINAQTYNTDQEIQLDAGKTYRYIVQTNGSTKLIDDNLVK